MNVHFTPLRMSVRSLVVTLALGGLIASGCGSPDSPAPTTSPTTPTTSSTTAPAPTVTVEAPVVLYNFDSPEAVNGWTTVNDTVMGGVSTATVSWNEGALVFAGTVSLDNNGGFTSVVGPPDGALGSVAASTAGLSLVGTGDGRTYVAQLRTTTGGFIQRFATAPGQAAVWELPFDGFSAVDFMLDPRPAAPPLDPATISQIAIYLLDGQEGPFTLSVTEIVGLTP